MVVLPYCTLLPVLRDLWNLKLLIQQRKSCEFYFLYHFCALLSAENEVRRYHNVAQLKTSSQSSSLSPNNAAGLAVDDSPATCARTDEESEASWMVDLGQIYVVSHLRINTGWLVLRI